MRETAIGFFFFFQAEDGIRDADVTGVQTCALPIWTHLGDRDMRYLNAAAAAAVNAIAITASLGADRALRKTYGQSLADALARGGSSIQSTSRSVVASSSRSVRI